MVDYSKVNVPAFIPANFNNHYVKYMKDKNFIICCFGLTTVILEWRNGIVNIESLNASMEIENDIRNYEIRSITGERSYTTHFTKVLKVLVKGSGLLNIEKVLIDGNSSLMYICDDGTLLQSEIRW